MSWKAILTVTLLLSAVTAYGHPVPRQTKRELIRIAGHRTSATPDGTQRALVLVAMGKEHAFAASDWRIFGFSDEAANEPTPVPLQRFSLQGSREDLMRFAAARPEQFVTLLAEHRPGSADLFILTLDLCPQQ